MDNISKHITYNEAVFSTTAIRKGWDNTPNDKILRRMKATANLVFEPLRYGLGGHPIRVTSFYRSPKLNKAIGGAKYSAHMRGSAIDLKTMDPKIMTNRDIFNFISKHLCFDKLIWEFGTDTEPAWVHVAFTSTKRNRNIILKAVSKNDRAEYINFVNK